MVRKDPLNERGPAPLGGRPKPPVGRATPTTLFELRPEAEYHRLWEILIQSTTEQINLIHLYASLGLPGIPVEDLELLRDRIDQIIPERRDQHE